MILTSNSDIEKIKNTAGIVKVTPMYTTPLEYIATSNEEKYEAVANQYIEGLNLEMLAGRTVGPNSLDEITVPSRYIKPGTHEEAIGKYIAIGYKDSAGKIVQRILKLVGVQQQSLLGNTGINISSSLAEEIYKQQTAGISALSGGYQGAVAQHDPNYDEAKISDLKKRLDEAGYSASTLEDQIGTIGTVINGILIVLNVFGVITLLAATFGIVNTLLMSVNERTSEIGLMKALGANRKTIFSIFAFEAMSTGFWGALLGVTASMLLGTVVNNIATETFLKDFVGFDLLAFPILPSAAVLFGIVLLALIAGTLPSLKASKLDPIKALRYE